LARIEVPYCWRAIGRPECGGLRESRTGKCNLFGYTGGREAKMEFPAYKKGLSHENKNL
jgi:hypothetical protein